MLLPKGQDSDQVAVTHSIAETTPETARFETVTGPPLQSGLKNKFSSTMLGLAPLPSAGAKTPAEPAPATVPPPAPAPEATAFVPAAPATTAFSPAASAKPTAEPHRSQSIEPKRKRSTMLGLAFSLPQPAPTTKAENPSTSPSRPRDAEGSSHHSTMLGMPSILTQHLPTKTPEIPVAEPDKQQSSTGGDKHSTMLGLPSSLAQTDSTNQATRTLLGQGTFSASPPMGVALPLTDTGKGTLIGVAIPGIAPINPGVAKAVAKEPNENSVAPSEAPRGESSEERTSAKTRTRAVGHTLFWTLSTVAIVLALVSLAAVWRWRASPKLEVQVQSDEAGNDSLAIECKNCDETVSFAIDNAKTKVRNHHATIPLRTPLKIGPNRVSVTMTRDTHRPEIIQLNFPVDYRVTGDLSGLDDTPARLRLRV